MSAPRLVIADTLQLSPAAQAAFDELRHQLREQVRLVQRAVHTIEEGQARQEIRRRLPRTGAWLIEHPRALRFVFRLRPMLRPTIVRRQGELIGRIV